MYIHNTLYTSSGCPSSNIGSDICFNGFLLTTSTGGSPSFLVSRSAVSRHNLNSIL